MSGIADNGVIDAVERLEAWVGLVSAHHSRQFIEDMTMVMVLARQTVELGIQIPSPPDKRMEDMTEPELSAHLSRQLRFIKGCQSEDTVGTMLIVFQGDGICQYGGTVHPEDSPNALRELADRLENRETVER